ncbi:hypothetical protein [Croceicoccus marinus]|uniref:ZIP family metal transporter n=1 Tax=Croceicoccus marinus TaxID=450378 RepID=A0A1Z1F9F9_9SPHN|nr:hypothetical protein [Croceicoccus marinus]ARU15420.1 hypothetical protein A9D14_03585 [Croceicoccus marinus]
MLLPITAAMTAVFVAIHLYIGRLRWLDVLPRHRWLSFSGGVAVGYVFLHLLPDLALHQRAFSNELGLSDTLAESMVYSLALLGLVAFYALERKVRLSRAKSRAKGKGDQYEDHLEWVHASSYAALNLLIGYLLLHREEGGWASLTLYFGAMALHFMTVDHGMREDHREAYERRGRWVISAAVAAGWLLGALVTVPQVGIGFLFAFLAGGIVLNTLKEELPQERESRLWPFLTGTGLYAALMLAGEFIA